MNHKSVGSLNPIDGSVVSNKCCDEVSGGSVTCLSTRFFSLQEHFLQPEGRGDSTPFEEYPKLICYWKS